jgi:hypothetical protein
MVGWGTKFLDYDNDGNQDLVVANGHINQVIETTRSDVKYQELALLLRNNGDGSFRNMGDHAGSAFSSAYVARGLAIGDIDNDGDPDVVFTRLNERPVLLRNNVGQDNQWVGLELQGTRSNRDAIGAKITVFSGKRRIVRWITGGSSYLSSHDKRVLVGLGRAEVGSSVTAEIRWPGGAVQSFPRLAVNRYHRILEKPSP